MRWSTIISLALMLGCGADAPTSSSRGGEPGRLLVIDESPLQAGLYAGTQECFLRIEGPDDRLETDNEINTLVFSVDQAGLPIGQWADLHLPDVSFTQTLDSIVVTADGVQLAVRAEMVFTPPGYAEFVMRGTVLWTFFAVSPGVIDTHREARLFGCDRQEGCFTFTDECFGQVQRSAGGGGGGGPADGSEGGACFGNGTCNEGLSCSAANVCGNFTCTEAFVFGVNVSVSDQAGQPVTGALLTLTEGNASETMEEMEDGEYAGAGELIGTYTLIVEADGFEVATIENIVVGEDECHVIPESRDVILSPS